MAISDANYKFIYVNVGAFGSEGDSGVFETTTLGKQIYKDEMPLPPDTTIGGIKMPFFFISDDAFPLSTRVMKPFKPTKTTPLTQEQKVFNYRLSRARRCVENSFGILSRKWLCLSQPLRQMPGRASKIVLTCCVLHNLLLQNKIYCPHGYADYFSKTGELIEGEWRKNYSEMTPLNNTCTGRFPQGAKQNRDKVKNFVNSIYGRVPWQDNI